MPGRTDVHQEFLDRRDETGFARDIVTPDQAPLGVRLMQEARLAGAIGTPDQVVDLLRRYEAVGVDEVGMVLQAGRNAREHICESLELFGAEVIPHLAEGREGAKRRRPSGSVRRSRRSRGATPRRPSGEYVVDEQAELERAEARRRTMFAPADLARRLRDELRHGVRRQGRRALSRFVDGASDPELERRFGSQPAQRALLVGMARSFDPSMAFGFEGDIEYELSRRRDGDGAGQAGRPVDDPDRWRPGAGASRAGADPALTVRIDLVDFVRIAAGESPMPAFLDGRIDLEGDLRSRGGWPRCSGTVALLRSAGP